MTCFDESPQLDSLTGCHLLCSSHSRFTSTRSPDSSRGKLQKKHTAPKVLSPHLTTTFPSNGNKTHHPDSCSFLSLALRPVLQAAWQIIAHSTAQHITSAFRTSPRVVLPPNEFLFFRNFPSNPRELVPSSCLPLPL